MKQTNSNIMSTELWPEPNMMLYTAAWANMPTFSLMPVSKDCPFVECIYNPKAKTLAIIGKEKKDAFHMLPRLDPNGQPEKIKNSNPEAPKTQRVSQETYKEYYITGVVEVEDFIKKFAVNHESFGFKKFLDMEFMQDAPTEKDITIPEAPSLVKV